jgi:phosphoglycerol transferase MdoB-like AlkP superfamily enzyme
MKLLLFLFGCMGARLGLTWTAYKYPQFLPWLGMLALAISAGFALIYVNGWRKTGVETGGRPIWWNNLRPFHALTYGLFAVLALKGVKKHAWKVLLFDTLIGFLAFMRNYFS